MLAAYLECFFCERKKISPTHHVVNIFVTINLIAGHFCLWRMGIQHGDVSLGNLMWDDERKVGVLNDFDFAKFVDQTGTGRQDNMGTVPFMALDLLSEEAFRGEIPRLYRHEAESFAWSLIYLHLATVEGDDGKNRTINRRRLEWWFVDWRYSRAERIAHDWNHEDDPQITLAYPNARRLARSLHGYWVRRYCDRNASSDSEDDNQLPAGQSSKVRAQPSAKDGTPRVEPGDDQEFKELLERNSRGLKGQKAAELLNEMREEYNKIDWDAYVHSSHILG